MTRRSYENTMTGIAGRIAEVRGNIKAAAEAAGRDPGEIRLLAATKQQPVDRILEAIAAGVDAVGENRVQEMRGKSAAYNNAELHFIGRLQKNKVKDVVGKAALIHSVDSFELADIIACRAKTQDIVQDVLLQVNIAGEDSKGGFSPEEVLRFFSKNVQLDGLRVRGLMCIPPVNGGKIFFPKISKLYVDIKQYLVDNNRVSQERVFSVLSMGMSGDYALAVRYGSNLVRVGSAIFGPRETGI